MSNCKPGYIVREGYYRKPYTRKDGVRVKGGYVSPVCVKDQGKKGKGPKLFKLKPGGLGKYGYYNIDSTPPRIRHKALEKGIKAEGYAPISRRLNALRTVNKNKPLFVHLDKDMKWMMKVMKPRYSKSAKTD